MAVWISDPAATFEYYVDGLGLERTRHAVIDGVDNYLVGGIGGLEIQFKHEPGRTIPDPSGIDHVAIVVDDVDATVDRLVDMGHPVVGGPFDMEETSNRVAFVRDPDGYVVELIAPLG